MSGKSECLANELERRDPVVSATVTKNRGESYVDVVMVDEPGATQRVDDMVGRGTPRNPHLMALTFATTIRTRSR